MEGNYDHGRGGVGVDQLLQELSAAGGQAGVVVHVLQHGDQLQLQIHRRFQAWSGDIQVKPADAPDDAATKLPKGKPRLP